MDRVQRRSAWSTVALFLLFTVLLAFLEWDFRMITEAPLAELHERRKRIRTLEAVAAHLDSFKEEDELLDARVESARRLLPPAPDVGALRSELRDIARATGVRVSGILNGPFRGKELHTEIPLPIEVRGTAATVASFGAALSSAPRLLVVRQAEIEPRGAELWARFDVRAFYAPQPDGKAP